MAARAPAILVVIGFAVAAAGMLLWGCLDGIGFEFEALAFLLATSAVAAILAGALRGLR